MKLLQLPKPDRTFEGRSPEQAVKRARDVLGDDAPLRCWKVRRGGVLGFFQKESFVAGVTAPAGVKSGETRAKRREKKVAPEANPVIDAARVYDDLVVEAVSSGAIADAVAATDVLALALDGVEVAEAHGPVAAGQTSLFDLVNATSDEVTLHGTDVEAAFSDVLAQAEAALVASVLELDPVASETDADSTGETEETVPFDALAIADRLEDLEGLASCVAALGVPEAFRPAGDLDSIDEVVRALAALPAAAPLPTASGSIIVVVGGRADAQATAQQLLRRLNLEARDLVIDERSSAQRQRVARRRKTQRVTVVIVEASLRTRDLGDTAAWIERLRPDYVLGAVPATVKRADVTRWSRGLVKLDALALTRMVHTATPGELMGELPIAFIDGKVASSLRWTLFVLAKFVDGAS